MTYEEALNYVDDISDPVARYKIKKAISKQVKVKPYCEGIGGHNFYCCPTCGEIEFGFNNPEYCENCGQHILWG